MQQTSTESQKPQTMSPALLWAAHSVSPVLSTPGPGRGELRSPGSSARQGPPAPGCVQEHGGMCPSPYSRQLCEQTAPAAGSLWRAEQLGPILQEALRGGLGRGCCWLSRAARCGALGAAPSPCAGSQPRLSAAPRPKKRQAENLLLHPVPFPWLCPLVCPQWKTRVGQASQGSKQGTSKPSASATLPVSFELAAQQIWQSTSDSGGLIFP